MLVANWSLTRRQIIFLIISLSSNPGTPLPRELFRTISPLSARAGHVLFRFAPRVRQDTAERVICGMGVVIVSWLMHKTRK